MTPPFRLAKPGRGGDRVKPRNDSPGGRRFASIKLRI